MHHTIQHYKKNQKNNNFSPGKMTADLIFSKRKKQSNIGEEYYTDQRSKKKWLDPVWNNSDHQTPFWANLTTYNVNMLQHHHKSWLT